MSDLPHILLLLDDPSESVRSAITGALRKYGPELESELDDLDPAPIGFALMLAGDDPADRVAPAFFYAYGW